MKLLTVLLVLFSFCLCACSQNLTIGWFPSDSADYEGLTYYTVYKWEGDSTQWLNWQVTDMDSIGILPHVLNFSGTYEFDTYFDETKIICAGACVSDTIGRQSEMGLTRFYFHPSGLKVIWIEK